MSYRSGAAASLDLVDIRDKGAIGDTILDASGTIVSGFDCSAALAAALAGPFGGGPSGAFVPRGKFRLHTAMVLGPTPVQYGLLVVRGVGSNSRLYLDAPTHGIAIDGTYGTICFEDLAICGNGNTGDSGFAPVGLGSANNVVLNRLLFAGLKGSGPSSVELSNLHTALLDCNFIGCGGPANTDGLVAFHETQNTSLIRVNFLDIGGPESFGSNVNNGAWVYFGEPNHNVADSGAASGRIYLEECNFDESSKYKVNIQGSPTYRWNHVELKACQMLINNVVDPGIIVKCADVVEIRNHRASQSGPAALTRTAIRLIDCGDVLIENFRGMPLLRRIEVDDLTKCVTFKDCGPYTLALTTSTLPPCYDVTFGITSRWRIADGAVVANTLGKMSTSVGGRVTQFLATDDQSLVTCTILDDGNDGDLVRCIELEGQVAPLKSDGFATIPVGAGVDPSPSVDGRVRAGLGVLGFNNGPLVAATLDDIVEVL